jgi:pentatricopeptide repeat protein
MRSIKGMIKILVIFSALLSILSCDRTRDNLLDRMLEFERGGYRGQDIQEDRIREIEDLIARYEKAVDDAVELTAQAGEYYKLLAIEYIDREMYGLALESIHEAIRYFPENPLLFYLAGMSSGRMAKAAVNQPESREVYLSQAEEYYLRAIELDNQFTEALYGLSVLYVFEMDRVLDAEPYLLRILERETRHIEAMFLLARVYVYEGRIEEAVELYDRIIRYGQSPEQRERAEENKQSLLDRQFSFFPAPSKGREPLC